MSMLLIKIVPFPFIPPIGCLVINLKVAMAFEKASTPGDDTLNRKKMQAIPKLYIGNILIAILKF